MASFSEPVTPGAAAASDPWADVKPLRMSTEEVRARMKRGRANRQQEEPGPGEAAGPRERKGRGGIGGKTILTTRELERMTSQVVRVAYDSAVNEEAKAADRKHGAVAFGVGVDKMVVLRARPDRRPDEDADVIRAGVRELARVILGI